MANAVPTIDTTLFPNAGLVRLAFTNANKGANWYSWRVYRKDSTLSAGWTLLKEYLVDQAQYYFDDYFAKSNVSQDYSVVRVYLVTGTPTEEAKDIYSATPVSDRYWLVHPIDPAQVYQLYLTKSDNFATESDMGVLQVIGRGRKIDQGTYWGIKGSISTQLRDDALRSGNMLGLSSFEGPVVGGNPPGFGNYGPGTTSVINTDKVFGSQCYRIVTTADGNGAFAYAKNAAGGALSVVEYQGKQITFSGYRKITAYTSGTASPLLGIYNSANAYVGTVQLPSATAVDANWVRVSGTATLPSNADHVIVYLVNPVCTVQWDALQVEPGAVATPYVPAEYNQSRGQTARTQIQQLKATQQTKSWYWLRNPFGDITRVAISNVQTDRLAGVGLSEFADVSFDYMEIVP